MRVPVRPEPVRVVAGRVDRPVLPGDLVEAGTALVGAEALVARAAVEAGGGVERAGRVTLKQGNLSFREMQLIAPFRIHAPLNYRADARELAVPLALVPRVSVHSPVGGAGDPVVATLAAAAVAAAGVGRAVAAAAAAAAAAGGAPAAAAAAVGGGGLLRKDECVYTC